MICLPADASGSFHMRFFLFALSLLLASGLCAEARGSVERKLFGMPVLTVSTRSGGCFNRLPFSFERTNAETPLKILVADDTPSGSGASIRSSVWLAAVTAAMQRNDSMSGVRITVEFSGNIDGPSAGGVMCLSILSAMDGREVPSDFAMTGTIMPDGTIGAVGGVAQKLKAAMEAGCRRICIPALVRFERQDDGTMVDLFGLGEGKDVEIRPVFSIGEAYDFAHGERRRRVNVVESTDVCRLTPRADALLVAHCQEAERGIKALRAEIPESLLKSLRDEQLFASLLFKSDYVREYVAGRISSADAHVTELFAAWKAVPPWVSRVSDIMAKYPVLSKDPPYDRATRKAYEKALNELREAFDESSKKIFEAVSPRDRASGGNCNGYRRDQKGISEIAAQSETACADISVAAGALFCLKAATIDPENVSKIEDAKLRDVLEMEMRKEFCRILCEKILSGDDGRVSLTPFYKGVGSLRPNASLNRAENLFYSAWAAVDVAIASDIVKRRASQVSADDDRVLDDFARRDIGFATYYFAKSRGGIVHSWGEKPENLVDPSYHAVATLCRNAQILASACTILVKYGVDLSGSFDDDGKYVCGNPEFLNHLVRRARVNALQSIDECVRADIPCIAAKSLFECADGADVSKLDAADVIDDVLKNYWEAGLTAKALLMGFLKAPGGK